MVNHHQSKAQPIPLLDLDILATRMPYQELSATLAEQQQASHGRGEHGVNVVGVRITKGQKFG